MKGAAEGDAIISTRHANFILNRANAAAADVLALIARARKAAFDALGICLELEIEVW